jgi:hypothetical protein
MRHDQSTNAVRRCPGRSSVYTNRRSLLGLRQAVAHIGEKIGLAGFAEMADRQIGGCGEVGDGDDVSPPVGH